MNLKELFIEISSNYLKSIKEPLTGHPLAQLIRERSKEIISNLINDQELTIKGSPGMGNWNFVPWIAIFNKNETDGAQEGIYVVYLFSDDLKRLYLTFNQGITNPIVQFGRKVAIQKLQAKALDIRTNFTLQNFNSDNNIKLSNGTPGSDYEKVTIFYKEYSLDNLPENDTLLSDLKQLISFYNNYLLDSNVLTSGTDFQNFVGKVEEGKRILKKHYIRERNPKIIKEAKALALQKSNLKCEVCNFSFSQHYGERAKDFIEGHHKKPISEMKEGEITSINDIALICSNCHRVIHLKIPWLTIEEIKQIYN